MKVSEENLELARYFLGDIAGCEQDIEELAQAFQGAMMADEKVVELARDFLADVEGHTEEDIQELAEGIQLACEEARREIKNRGPEESEDEPEDEPEDKGEA